MQAFFEALVFILSSFLLTQITEPYSSSHSNVLQQLRRQLEFPKQLDAWNSTEDLCYSPLSSVQSVTCESNLVVELKIIGDKFDKPHNFDGYAVSGRTLSSAFSADSFFTTLSRLPSLKVVILVSLGIWGPLPDKIHRLPFLEVLDLSSNFLFGSIPQKIPTMKMLQTLILDGNFFNGTVPDWFDSFSNLTNLSIQHNRLEGPLPLSIGRMHSLTRLSLSGNGISGRIPDLSGLSSLEVLDMEDNELDSELPLMPEILVTVLLGKNRLSGDIPKQIGELSRLQHLDLSFNLLEGTLLTSLFSLPNLTYLNMASNKLTGFLPVSLTCGNQLGFVDISANMLMGGLPSCLSSKLNKMVVKLGGNCLTIDLQNQHEASYCQAHSKGKLSKTQKLGLLVGSIGGVTCITLLLMLVFLVICRRNHRPPTAKECVSKPVVDNSATGLSSQHLGNTRSLSVANTINDETSSTEPSIPRYPSKAMKLVTQVLPSYRAFSLEDLKEATKNFESSSYIGEGTAGKLYKGKLENGTYVAIRCIIFSKRYSIRNLKLRLDLLSKLRHPHLVCLLGHCIDETDVSNVDRVFLVYEYVPNGNFHAHLSECSMDGVLKWSDRLAALIGIAKAVHFLHTGVIPGFFSNHLQTHNILFDEHFVAKLSDYGLFIITEEIQKNEARYDDQKTLQSKSKAPEEDTEDDVYSFGLILLETLVGPSRVGKGQALFLNELDQKRLLDPIVIGTSSHESLSTVVSLTNKCLSMEVSLRPSIEDILWNLQYATQVQATLDCDGGSGFGSQA